MLNKCSKEGKVCTLQIRVDRAIEVGVLDDQPLPLLGFHQLLFHHLDLGLRLLDALFQGPLLLSQAPDDDLIKRERVEGRDSYAEQSRDLLRERERDLKLENVILQGL